MLLLPVIQPLLLDVPAGICEPVVELSERHACVLAQLLLLALGGVQVLLVEVEPLYEHPWVAAYLASGAPAAGKGAGGARGGVTGAVHAGGLADWSLLAGGHRHCGVLAGRLAI